MAYIAKWGSKGFIVSPNKVVGLEKLTTEFKLKQDTNNDTSGTPSTNTRGRELEEITLSTTYVAAAGVNPRGQIDEWNKLVGARYPLYIGGKQFGADLLELTSVSVSEVRLSNRGDIISARVEVKLREYQPQAAAISTKPDTGETTSVMTAEEVVDGAKQRARQRALTAEPPPEQKTGGSTAHASVSGAAHGAIGGGYSFRGGSTTHVSGSGTTHGGTSGGF